MGSESTALVGDKPAMLKVTLNIELFRVFGLSAGFVLLFIGTAISNRFVFEPYGDKSKTETYIYKTFGFNHTCTYLDWNPSRTVSAMVSQLCIVPLCIYVFLNYYRMKFEYKAGKISDSLWTFCQIASPFCFIFILLFFMVFVNHPLNRLTFIFHYIPYMFFQMALLLVAVEQVWYLAEKDIVPFNIPRPLLKIYLVIVGCTFVYYTVFIWSFMIEHPILDTSVPWKKNVGVGIMFFWDLVAIMIPMVFGFIESKNGLDQTLCFYTEVE